jgi:hypothetical protein
MSVRYVMELKITDVIEKQLTVGGRKSADGTAELFTESGGWHIVIGNLSIHVGNEQPPFKKGQAVRLILEG